MTTKNLQYESGRSMVEMLGTLAIIGVLSVGGIAGYSYGMDKHRANQTMRDISLRTVDLLTQASQGRATLSLAEWNKEPTIYDFTNPTYSDGGLIKFDIGTTKKIPVSVCEMLFDGLSNTVAQIDINGTPSTSNDNCGEDNTMTFYFAGGGSGTTDTGGETGEQCGDTVCGTCQKCDSATETCVTVSDYEAKCTTDDNKTGWCVSGACEPDTTCNCGKGYYCTDTNDSCYNPTPSGNCVEADSQFRTVDIEGTTYYISNNPMSWWDAVSAREALGNKKLLSVYDFVNDFDSTNESSQYLSRTDFTEELFNKGWNGSGYPYVWTSNLANSCRAVDVFLNKGGSCNVNCGGGGRDNGNDIYAVCR